jgi:hypothetical protein
MKETKRRSDNMEEHKKKKEGIEDFIDHFAYDISVVPTYFTDLTTIPLTGGLITRNYVELGEEMLAEDFVEYAKTQNKEEEHK